jgi:PKD repeat protein
MLVSYDGNGNTGGTAPSPTDYNFNDVVILPDPGTLEKDDSIFYSWNTSSDGTGEHYLPGDGYRIATGITFYVCWLETYVGGLVGDNVTPPNVTDSYWDEDVSEIYISSGGEGKTTEEMMLESTFVNWDFINTWLIKENISYPDFYIVNFSINGYGGGAPYSVNFSNLTKWWPDENALVIDRTWDFGDGHTSSELNPVYTYDYPGFYFPSLTESRNYLSDNKILSSPISVTGNLAVDFVGTPTKGYISLSTSFTDITPGIHNGWYWEFGDGNTSTEENPEHFYEHAGLYTVSLTIYITYGSSTLSYKATKLNYITISSHITYDTAPEPDLTCYLWGTAIVAKDDDDNIGIRINKQLYRGSGDEAGFVREKGPTLIFD